MTPASRFVGHGPGLADRLARLPLGFVLVLAATASVGCAMLYSAAGGSFEPWAWRHATRFLAALVVMLGVALVPPRVWLRAAYPLYAASFLSLVAVELLGFVGKGARRWLDLGLIQIQPPEIMKVALVLALARLFQKEETAGERGHGRVLLALALVLAPAALVLRQPDLGTAGMLIAAGVVVIFLAGASLWLFAAGAGVVLAGTPVAWGLLYDYQRRRVLTFLNPGNDPLGAGYHIIQSKIAFGSGGVWGKGLLGGTQSQLNFLPEKQTDFVFTMLAEETGLIGGLFLLSLCALIVAHGLAAALRARTPFARLVASGVTTTFFLYVVINVGMVTGLVPVVGVPLPFVSYGGTAMLTTMIGFGFLLSVDVHGDQPLPKFPGDDVA